MAAKASEFPCSDKEAPRPQHANSSGRQPRDVRSVSISGLFVLALMYTATVAAPVIIPVTCGFLLSMILASPVRRLVRWRVPRSLASALMIMLVVVGGYYLLRALSEPATTWLQDMPDNASEVAERIKILTTPIQDVTEVAEEVEKLAQLNNEDEVPPTVKVEAPSFAQILIETAPRLLASVALSLFLAFLLLNSGDALLRKIIGMVTELEDRQRILHVTKLIQADLFRYLSAVTMVNVGLGLLTAAVLYVLGVPHALLWGGVAALLNYAPLLGPAITVAILALVGLTTFESTAQALMVPGIYFLLTSLEGQLVSPMIIGRRLALSPVIVLISLVLFAWMWGVPGLLLAIPIVSSARIICANIPSLNNIAVLLGRQ